MENLLREVAKSTARQFVEDTLKEAANTEPVVQVFHLARSNTYVVVVRLNGKERRLELTEAELFDQNDIARDKVKKFAQSFLNDHS